MSMSLSRLRSFYGELSASLLLHALIKREFSGCVGLLITGAPRCEGLLAAASAIDLALPVLVKGAPDWAQRAREHGFTQVKEVDAESHLIESLALLAVIGDSETLAHGQKITLDEEGVFRIYPYLVMTPDPDKPFDWSL